MKAKQILMAISITGMLILSACGSKSQKEMKQAEAESPKNVYYTCTMHPEVHSDKPGKCPKCSMELVKKEMVESDSTHMHQDMDSTEHHH